MAEAAAAVPTFKLVLVGDGGTGKVRSNLSPLCAIAFAWRLEAHLHIPVGGGALSISIHI